MLFVNGVIGTVHGIFHIADHRIDPGKCLHGDTLRPTASDDSLMLTIGFLHATKAVQAIGDHEAGSHQMSLRPLGDLRLAKSLYPGETHGDGVTLFIGLHGRDEWSLGLGTTPTLTTVTFTTPVRIIQLDDTRQGFAVVALLHDLQQLMLHPPSRFVADAQLALHFQSRDSVLRLRQQVHSKKPSRQRQLGVLENRAAAQRCLSVATVALVQAACGNLTVAGMPTFRADESAGPAPPEQSAAALLFSAKLLEKLWQTEPFLKLNLILGHGYLLVWLQVQYAPLAGSIAEPQG